ncbi:cell surface A33 antigen-like [Megalops cyprinoides]|uniref:cell surface A33 antigen-like n=1 Tax=Megalops cyprinoides TaxID=118141 RepID=UPI001863BB79|nr:cell surface A33 antigen-like [Megalops cyprinoides]
MDPRYKDRVQVLNSASLGNMSLLLFNLTKSDEGAYRCEDGDQKHKDIRLSVKGCSLSNSGPMEVTGYTGGSVTLPCSCSDTQAAPQKIQWFVFNNDWKSIFPPKSPNMNPHYRDRVQVLNSASPGNMSLLLSNLTESDTGTYRCEAGDHKFTDIRLSVKGCSLSDSGRVEEVTGYTGGLVILPCSCSETQAKPDNIKWTFFNNDQAVIFPPKSPNTNPRYKDRVQVLNSASPGNMSLLLSHLTKSDEGIYRCEAGDRKYKDIQLYMKDKKLPTTVMMVTTKHSSVQPFPGSVTTSKYYPTTSTQGNKAALSYVAAAAVAVVAVLVAGVVVGSPQGLEPGGYYHSTETLLFAPETAFSPGPRPFKCARSPPLVRFPGIA